MAAVKGRTDAVRLLLRSKAAANPRTKSAAPTEMLSGGALLWGETPLHFAAAYGDADMISALLDGGADSGALNAQGERPLAYAGRHQRPSEIRTLLA